MNVGPNLHFKRLLKIRTYLLQRRRREYARIESSYHADVERAYISRYPKRKPKSFLDISIDDKLRDMVKPIFATYKPIADAAYDRYKKNVLIDLDQMMYDTADLVTLTPMPHLVWSLYDSTSTYDYSTQTAAYAYAKHRAAIDSLKPQFYDIPFEIIEVPGPYYPRHSRSQHYSCKFNVWVALPHYQTVALQMKFDGPTLVDRVRLCYSVGADPRVYYPMLPHWFERFHKLGEYANRPPLYTSRPSKLKLAKGVKR